MAELEVRVEPAGDGWTARVRVTDRGTTTEHEVAVTAADLARLAAQPAGPAVLVERSFRFLLAREPKESILRRFGIADIARYFPEYEREMRSD